MVQKEPTGRRRAEALPRDVDPDVNRRTLGAPRPGVLRARHEPGMDPEVADRVLRELDLRTPRATTRWAPGTEAPPH